MADATLDTLFSAGNQTAVKAGTVIFQESRRVKLVDAASPPQMYLLVSGEVTLMRNGKPLELVFPGEIFGATALISGATRMATATARKDCVVKSINRAQLIAALKATPEFALTLIEGMGKRLSSSFQRAMKSGLSFPEPLLNTGTLLPGVLAEIGHALGDPVPMRAEPGGTIITKDGIGMYLYVLIDGKVAISVGDQVVEHVGPEAVFGELAMIGGANRTATAVAVEPCKWYPLNRTDFLQLVQNNPEIGLSMLRSLSDRVRRSGFLLSESPQALRAFNSPRLNAAAAGKLLGSIRMLYNRAAKGFMDDTVGLLGDLVKRLSANDRDASIGVVEKLHEMATKIGAERFAFQLDVLGSLLQTTKIAEFSADPQILNQLQALKSEFQDTCDELTEYLKSG